MKAPITQAQAWAVIAESAGWNAKELPVLPVIWAISYDGVTPYTLWHEGDGPLLDCEVKRQGGTTQKMPLFTRPMPAQDVTELVELTDAQILTLWEETYVQRGWTGIEFARAIERAHGIGAKQ